MLGGSTTKQTTSLLVGQVKLHAFADLPDKQAVTYGMEPTSTPAGRHPPKPRPRST